MNKAIPVVISVLVLGLSAASVAAAGTQTASHVKAVIHTSSTTPTAVADPAGDQGQTGEVETADQAGDTGQVGEVDTADQAGVQGPAGEVNQGNQTGDQGQQGEADQATTTTAAP